MATVRWTGRVGRTWLSRRIDIGYEESMMQLLAILAIPRCNPCGTTTRLKSHTVQNITMRWDNSLTSACAVNPPADWRSREPMASQRQAARALDPDGAEGHSQPTPQRKTAPRTGTHPRPQRDPLRAADRNVASGIPRSVIQNPM